MSDWIESPWFWLIATYIFRTNDDYSPAICEGILINSGWFSFVTRRLWLDHKDERAGLVSGRWYLQHLQFHSYHHFSSNLSANRTTLFVTCKLKSLYESFFLNARHLPADLNWLWTKVSCGMFMYNCIIALLQLGYKYTRMSGKTKKKHTMILQN